MRPRGRNGAAPGAGAGRHLLFFFLLLACGAGGGAVSAAVAAAPGVANPVAVAAPADAPLPAPPTSILATRGLDQAVTLNWTNPLNRTDGSAFTDFGGVTIYRDGFIVASVAQVHTDDPLPTRWEDSSRPATATYRLSTFDRRPERNQGPLSGPVVLAPAQPSLALLTPEVVGSLARNGPPRTYPLVIRNNGPGLLRLTATADAAWLSLDTAERALSPGQESTWDLVMNPAGLAPGGYSATVRLASNDPGHPLVEATARMIVGDPVLSLGATELVMSAGEGRPPVSIALEVGNGGAGLLQVDLAVSAPWLRLSRAALEVESGAPTSVGLTADLAGLVPGTYDDTLRVASNDPLRPQARVPVRLYVNPRHARLDVQPTTLRAVRSTRAGALTLELILVNDGYEELRATLSHREAWLTLPAGPFTLPGDRSLTLSARLDPTGLATGNHADTIDVRSNDPEHPLVRVPVQFTVVSSGGQTALLLSTQALELSGRNDQGELSRVVELRNRSVDPLAYELTDLPAWVRLAAEGAGTLLPSASATFDLRFRPTLLAPGVYTHFAVLRTNDSIYPEVPILLRLRVLGAPTCALSADSLRFVVGRRERQEKSFTIGNDGGAPLQFRLIGESPAYTVAPDTGTVQGGAAATIHVTLDGARLGAPGEYRHFILLSTDVPHPAGVTLLATVLDIDLAFGADTLRADAPFRGEPVTLPLHVLNTGGTPLTVAPGWLAPWIRLELPAPTLTLAAGGSTIIPVTLDPAGLAVGVNEALIQFHGLSAALERTVVVRLNVQGRQAPLLVAPTRFDFRRRVGQPVTAQYLVLRSEGSASVSYQPSTTAAWLSITPSTGGSSNAGRTGRYLVTADARLLAPGRYEDEIRLTTGDPAQPLITIPVTLEVGEAPEIPVYPGLLAIDEIAFACADGDTALRYIELIKLSSQPPDYSPTLHLRVTDRNGATLFDATNLFPTRAPGDRWELNGSWLIAGPAFEGATGLKPDLVLPLPLDAGGGTATLYDSAVEGWPYHRYSWGLAGGIESPAPGYSLSLYYSGPTHYIRNSQRAQPTNSARAWLQPPLPCPCPVDTLRANGQVIVGSERPVTVSDPGPVNPTASATHDAWFGTFALAAHDGLAAADLHDDFVLGGAPEGTWLAFDLSPSYASTLNLSSTVPGYAATHALFVPPAGAPLAFDHAIGGLVSPYSGSLIRAQAAATLQRVGAPFPLEWHATAFATQGGASLQARLDVVGLPPGVTLTSCRGYLGSFGTPIALAVASATVLADRVRLEWHGAGDVRTAIVYRRREPEEWRVRSIVSPDADGRLVYEDREIEPGAHYAYRVGLADEFGGLVEVDIPAAASTPALLMAPPVQPAGASLALTVRMPAAGDVTLQLFDVQGRRLAEETRRELAPGLTPLQLSASHPLRPGLYFIRAKLAAQAAAVRVLVVR